jgi:rifampicin phosphotransferase
MVGRRVAAQPSYSHKPYVEHPSDIWTRANAGEVLPGVLTPLTWSVGEDDWDKLFTITLQRVGIAQQGNSAQLFYGRIYFNFGLMAAGLKQLGLPTGDFLSNVGGPELEGDSLTEGFRPLRILRHLPGIVRERLAERGLHKRFERQVGKPTLMRHASVRLTCPACLSPKSLSS